MLHNPTRTSLNAHGYINSWQQAVIEGLKQKGAGKARTVKQGNSRMVK
jgi:hypothetical protein